MLVALLLALAPKPQLPSPVPHVDPDTWQSLVTIETKGDLSCRRGDPDCNPCTANVRAQFRKVREGDATWSVKPWRFSWGRSYVPDSIEPYEAFDEDTHLANALGVSYAHPQGFVRTNSGPGFYAGTHSQKEDGRPGTVFIVDQDAEGRKSLAALHRTSTRHPSGLHVLGKYLLFAERPKNRPDELRVIDLDRRRSRQSIAHAVPDPAGVNASVKQFGGGLGAAKLADGGYLILSAIPGDRRDEKRFHQFYRATGNLGTNGGLVLTFLHEQEFTPTTTVPAKYQYSENVSLVTECTTGDIYAIHTSGDGEGLDALIGHGYWRLSKLVKRGGKPALDPVDVFEMGQNTADCHMRSAASVGVAPNGKLEFICHQFRKDPDPSALNPLSGNIGGEDAWRFRVGVPND